jgi:acetolactate synthase-1/2/3 large subunit
MNGASSLVRTLLASGVDTCFANPGTSEMHFVAALDQSPACAACWACRRTWSPAWPTATGASPASRPARCCIAARAGQRPGQPAQRAPGAQRHRQHRRRPGHLAPALRSAADGRHRRLGAHRLGLGAHQHARAGRGRDARRRCRRRARPGQIATLILPSDASWDEGGVVADALPAGAAAARPASRSRTPRACCAAERTSCCCWPAPPCRRGAGAGLAHRAGHRRRS